MGKAIRRGITSTLSSSFERDSAKNRPVAKGKLLLWCLWLTALICLVLFVPLPYFLSSFSFFFMLIDVGRNTLEFIAWYFSVGFTFTERSSRSWRQAMVYPVHGSFGCAGYGRWRRPPIGATIRFVSARTTHHRSEHLGSSASHRRVCNRISFFFGYPFQFFKSTPRLFEVCRDHIKLSMFQDAA